MYTTCTSRAIVIGNFASDYEYLPQITSMDLIHPILTTTLPVIYQDIPGQTNTYTSNSNRLKDYPTMRPGMCSYLWLHGEFACFASQTSGYRLVESCLCGTVSWVRVPTFVNRPQFLTGGSPTI